MFALRDEVDSTSKKLLSEVTSRESFVGGAHKLRVMQGLVDKPRQRHTKMDADAFEELEDVGELKEAICLLQEQLEQAHQETDVLETELRQECEESDKAQRELRLKLSETRLGISTVVEKARGNEKELLRKLRQGEVKSDTMKKITEKLSTRIVGLEGRRESQIGPEAMSKLAEEEVEIAELKTEVNALRSQNESMKGVVPYKLVYTQSPESKTDLVTKRIISPEKEGPLLVCYKEGSRPDWVLRWVVLKENFLYIFLTDTDVETEAIIWCHGASVTIQAEPAGWDPAAANALRGSGEELGVTAIFQMTCPARKVSFEVKKGREEALRWQRMIEASKTVLVQDLATAEPPTWIPDEDAIECYNCPNNTQFGILSRKHHCRLCGLCYCSACSPKKIMLPGLGFKVRLCQRNCAPLALAAAQ